MVTGQPGTACSAGAQPNGHAPASAGTVPYAVPAAPSLRAVVPDGCAQAAQAAALPLEAVPRDDVPPNSTAGIRTAAVTSPVTIV